MNKFSERWQNASGTEKANYQLFLTELCAFLELPQPDPASSDTDKNAYVFERRIDFKHGDGTESRGFIDLYRRGCFVLEAKQTGQELDTSGWDKAMLRARSQAEGYARALPTTEGRPPFVLVVDVGRSIEIYSEFSQSGGTYVPFPDPRSHRIRLADLERAELRERLRQVWVDPVSLDPARRSARVTQELAARLGDLAKSLEQAGHHPDTVAAFLMRCLFTMFAEDIGLLPTRSFSNLLESFQATPDHFARVVPELWGAMNTGGFSAAIRSEVLRFNGGLFASPVALPMNGEQLKLLRDAAQADWREVEPAIFGALLERALDPLERHKLGAHYTPRAYVERLVVPTIIEPLRDEWTSAQAAALTLERQGKRTKAVEAIRDFHYRLCNTRVLDPACGSGNFLYVTLEHLKRLEGEVLNVLEDLGETQVLLDLAGVTVDPHQMLGLENNPRAARITEAVLWIGYLQWHFRTRGNAIPPQPVIRDFHNIECRDAVLAWDHIDYVKNESGIPVTRWDGRTYKKHAVTGEDVPDENTRVPMEHYFNPRKADWPETDFVVGNPPFIGTARMRQALGDGYAEALRGAYPDVPESADFVMYWWHQAAELARAGKIQRFGLITTNSLRQTFNRRVVQYHMEQKPPLSLVFAIPDRPWVDSADGAAVRIAMTAGQGGNAPGLLQAVTAESEGQGGEVGVVLSSQSGKLHSDLRIGADLSRAIPLQSNSRLSHRGMQLIGSGFILQKEEAASLGLGRVPNLEMYIREYRNGRDLTQTPRGVMVIDLFGLTAEDVRARFPEVYQWVIERVKPERDHNNRATYRDNWWIFGEPRRELRTALAGLSRYIATVETSKHRFFVFLDAVIQPDNKLINIALDSSTYLGILSSRVHISWALASGSNLGVGNDPVYVKSRCFETFPFIVDIGQRCQKISELAERLDAHRKQRQSLYPALTITSMYNILEKLRERETLNAKDRVIHEQALVSVLAQLHDDLDAAVLEAYGWSDLAPALVGKPGGTTPVVAKSAEQTQAEEELLSRLVALNAQRAAEEARGIVHWLRPEFQNTQGEIVQQQEMDTGEPEAMPAPGKKPPWPKNLPEQVQVIRLALQESAVPLTPVALAGHFTGARRDRVSDLLDTLVAMGKARVINSAYTLI